MQFAMVLSAKPGNIEAMFWRVTKVVMRFYSDARTPTGLLHQSAYPDGVSNSGSGARFFWMAFYRFCDRDSISLAVCNGPSVFGYRDFFGIAASVFVNRESLRGRDVLISRVLRSSRHVVASFAEAISTTIAMQREFFNGLLFPASGTYPHAIHFTGGESR